MTKPVWKDVERQIINLRLTVTNRDQTIKELREVLSKRLDAYSRTYDERNELKKNTDVYLDRICLLYTSPSPRDGLLSRMPSSA